ncbi:MAG TPA: hypothetical protein VES19_11600 [Candidatus Limnocylindrales bacterium]|nr:hypothetical protein [Candidatus Limnocylindrales bacterium]
MAASRVPRVAVIVGPAGGVTGAYKSLANEAVAAAKAGGAEVVQVYSPDATWPAVKRAVTGASIVVYLGHGNGWPSKYRDALYPPSQNGFGLNPRAGGDDYNHQYFGEAAIGKLELAPNAVVVLSHLCYASGNTEPGLSEGTRDQAIQRVDNYAAGFLRAGARAVVAEAYLGPAYYVKALLRGRGSIEAIWSASPTADAKHAFVAGSERTPGYKLHLDPERATGGYVRSLVSRGLTASEVRAGATGTGAGTGGIITPPTEPSLVSARITFSEPAFSTLPIVATGTKLTLPLASGRATRIPAGAQVSVRWDPILLDAPPAPEPTTAPTPAPTPEPTLAPTPTPVPTPEPSPTIDPNIIARFERPNAPTVPPEIDPAPEPTPLATTEPTPLTTPEPTPTPTPTPTPGAPEVDLVVPEQAGTVVTPAKASRGARGLSLAVTYPALPGLYRLTATLHTPEGVAYDAATQALLTPVLVRVGGTRAVAYGAPSTLVVTAAEASEVPVRVLNAGAMRWDQVVTAAPSRIAGESGLELRTTTLPAYLVATWVAGDGTAVPAPVSIRLDDVVFAPGGAIEALLALQAPDAPGSYLLILDVLTPESGPMSALGSAPAIIRVTVNAAAPTPTAPGTPIAPHRQGDG